MVIDHAWWPVISLVGASIYIDAAGREAAKNLSFRHEGINVGSAKEQKLFFATYILMLVLGVFVAIYSLESLIS